ncbi:Retrovirus-related Pol polyprotein, partial [Mucuna pruriens]
MKPNVALKIKEEVEKQWSAGFLAISNYPQRVANIVPVPKKDRKVMPFGLKNAGETYQREMMTLFHDMMHKEIEVYVDDMIAKSKSLEQHIEDLRKLFVRLHKYKLRLNPANCTFSVKTGKLLGFVVSERGIEVDPDKVKAIREMHIPRTDSKVQGFLGRVNFIARFIFQLTATCNPMLKLLRKKQKLKWDLECQKAFEKIKRYLEYP